ncbi:hypothetical protein TNCV_3399421, partial [Trichonephila clavipes]
GVEETLSLDDMMDCMDGKPLSDKSLQDCLFNNHISVNLPKKTLPMEEDGESSPKVLKCSTDEEEPKGIQS